MFVIDRNTPSVVSPDLLKFHIPTGYVTPVRDPIIESGLEPGKAKLFFEINLLNLRRAPGMDPLTRDLHHFLTENKLIVKIFDKNLRLGILRQDHHEDSISNILSDDTTYRELYSRQQTIDIGYGKSREITIDVPH